MRQREEKLEEQRQAQEERLRRALERSQADPKKRVRDSAEYSMASAKFKKSGLLEKNNLKIINLKSCINSHQNNLLLILPI